MNINLHIEADSPWELQEAISGLAHQFTAGVAPSQATPAEEPAPKRLRKTKDTQVKDPEPIEEQPVLDLKEEPQEDEKPKEETKATPEPEGAIPTVVDLRAIAAEKGQADAANKPKIRALLDSYGCKSISTVPEDKRLAVKADLEAL